MSLLRSFCVLGSLLPTLLGVQASEPFVRAWEARYNGPASGFDQVKAMALAPNGDVIMVGQTRGTGDVFEMLAWRVTAAGEPSSAWADNGAGVGVRRFRSVVGNSSAEAVVVRPDGITFIGGYRTTLDKFEDSVLINLTPAGELNPSWPTVGTTYPEMGIRNYDRIGGPDQIRALALSTDGNLLAAGRTVGVSSPSLALYLQYNLSGVRVGGQIYPTSGTNAAEAIGIVPMGSNGSVVGGRLLGVTGKYAYLFMRLNAGGGYTDWLGGTTGVRTYTGINLSNSEMAALARRTDGGVVATGRSANTDGLYDATTVSLSSNGTRIWDVRRRADPAGNDGGVALAVAPSGEIFVLSESTGGSTDSDFEILRYTAAGALSTAWADVGHGVGIRRWNGAADGADRPKAMVLDRLGNVYAAGETAVGDGSFAWVVVKFTAAGVLAWVDTYVGPGGEFDQPVALALGADDTVYAAGSSSGLSTGQDAAVIAYTQTFPELTVAPASVLGQEGGSLRLSATATGNPGLSYTWSREGQVVGSGPTLFPGPITAATAGNYTLSVSDGFNVITSSFFVSSLKILPGEGDLTLRVLGPAARNFVLDSSPDLVTWTPGAPFTVPAGLREFSVSLPAERIFYRLRAP